MSYETQLSEWQLNHRWRHASPGSRKPVLIHIPCAEYAVRWTTGMPPRCLECRADVPQEILDVGTLVGAKIPDYHTGRAR